MPVGRAQRPLTLRQSVALSSEKCGVLIKGEDVAVLKVIINRNGTVRAQVGRTTEESPLGWVTSFKGGVEMLRMGNAAEIRGTM